MRGEREIPPWVQLFLVLYLVTSGAVVGRTCFMIVWIQFRRIPDVIAERVNSPSLVYGKRRGQVNIASSHSPSFHPGCNSPFPHTVPTGLSCPGPPLGGSGWKPRLRPKIELLDVYQCLSSRRSLVGSENELSDIPFTSSQILPPAADEALAGPHLERGGRCGQASTMRYTRVVPPSYHPSSTGSCWRWAP